MHNQSANQAPVACHEQRLQVRQDAALYIKVNASSDKHCTVPEKVCPVCRFAICIPIVDRAEATLGFQKFATLLINEEISFESRCQFGLVQRGLQVFCGVGLEKLCGAMRGYAVLCGAMRCYAVLCGPVEIHAPLLPAMDLCVRVYIIWLVVEPNLSEKYESQLG